VYDRYHAGLYAFCLSRLCSPQAAEDVVQEVFLRFSATSQDRIQNPQAWLFAVARNLCVDAGRHSARYPRDEGDATETLENLSCGTDSADETMSREDAELLLLALRRLNPRYRAALILREVHGLSVPEIAEALETSEGATHTLLSRSRDALGRAVAEVSEAPQACRRAMILAFKSGGTGVSATERHGLDAHLAVCPDCRRRVRQAEGSNSLAALLPLLTAPDLHPTGLIARAFAALGEHAAMPTLSSCVQPAAKTIGAFMLAAAMIAPVASPVREPTHPDDGGSTAVAAAAGLPEYTSAKTVTASSESVALTRHAADQPEAPKSAPRPPQDAPQVQSGSSGTGSQPGDASTTGARVSQPSPEPRTMNNDSGEPTAGPDSGEDTAAQGESGSGGSSAEPLVTKASGEPDPSGAYQGQDAVSRGMNGGGGS
jgi:RNA polymerase sigma factor (sigma-70 family)